MEIDFSREETEAGWQAVSDNFWLKAVPLWFDWLKWVMMLAALLLVAKKSGSHMIWGLVVFSFVSVWFYFAAFFARIKLKGLSFAASGKRGFLVSLLLSSLLTGAAGWATSSLAFAVAAMTK